ncbi:hypothetical protein [Sporosalibacterium faouarense]|uniref:hypothetical protein n=1 Tax=Sporosalibacterium faouarense TaxID=516123 RepID=UPI00141C6B84|nr:hypothetical protein [Sporosalibacterium faouarense]MTI47002.1 hypothetical protein [Bacillota bacterium]
MKKIIAFMVILSLLLPLTACKDRDSVDVDEKTDYEDNQGEQEDIKDSQEDQSENSDVDKEDDYSEAEDLSNSNQDSEEVLLGEEDLPIEVNGGSINYNMTKSEAIEILGEPLEKITYEDSESIVTYKYDGIDITFIQEYIEVIKVIGTNYSTHRGIKVGDDTQKIFESYGEVSPVDIQGHEKYYMYELPTDTIEIQLFFVTMDGKIKEYYFCNSL